MITVRCGVTPNKFSKKRRKKYQTKTKTKNVDDEAKKIVDKKQNRGKKGVHGGVYPGGSYSFGVSD